MNLLIPRHICTESGKGLPDRAALDEDGFGLLEMLISSLILVLTAGVALGLLAEIERVAGHQADLQSAQDGLLVSLDVAQRLLRHSGDDPYSTGIAGLARLGPDEVRVRADMTGSAAPREPDKGDPDGDTADAFEDVVIRFNPSADTLELVSVGGGVQIIAENISTFAVRFYDQTGAAVEAGREARRARMLITSTCRSVDPREGRASAIQLWGDVELRAQQRQEP